MEGTDCKESVSTVGRGVDFPGVCAVGTTILAFCVVVLGAFVRLSDAGLACPDWPGCFGRLHAPSTGHQTTAAARAFPDWPIDSGKAWIEMIHRYLAGGLGLAVASLFVVSVKRRRQVTLTACLLLLVMAQALLGMLTVTQRLQPAIVTAHLLGGMSTAGLLLWLSLRHRGSTVRFPPGAASFLGSLALVVLVVQIGLGGWTSANGAALACEGFPRCLGEWFPAVSLTAAFEPGLMQSDGAATARDLTAIHIVHRLGALAAIVVLGYLAWRLYRSRARTLAAGLLGALMIQVGLGAGIALFERPLTIAVMHNANAAVLLLMLVNVLHGAWLKGMDRS